MGNDADPDDPRKGKCMLDLCYGSLGLDVLNESNQQFYFFDPTSEEHVSKQ